MIPLARYMRELMKGADQGFAEWLAQKDTRTPTCVRGCTACCELLALITWPEGVLLAEDLRERGEVERFLPALRDHAKRSSYAGIDPASYWERRIPCAFLQPDGDCGVYAARPTTCRFHIVFSPRERCAARGPDEETLVTQVDEAPLQAQVMVPILKHCNEQGFREAFEIAPVPVMVLGALEQLGELVGPILTPHKWFKKYGKHVWQEHRATMAKAVRGG